MESEAGDGEWHVESEVKQETGSDTWKVKQETGSGTWKVRKGNNSSPPRVMVAALTCLDRQTYSMEWKCYTPNSIPPLGETNDDEAPFSACRVTTHGLFEDGSGSVLGDEMKPDDTDQTAHTGPSGTVRKAVAPTPARFQQATLMCKLQLRIPLTIQLAASHVEKHAEQGVSGFPTSTTGQKEMCGVVLWTTHNSYDSENIHHNNNYYYDEDYYIYDYNSPTDYALPLAEVVPVTVLYAATLVVGLVGNLLVIVVLSRYRTMKNITNTFLLSLASADLLLVTVCIPVKFAAFFSFTWTFGAVLCKGVGYLQNVSALCSVLTLTAMSLERYYAILHPMRAKYVCTIGRARRAILLLWLTSLVLALPIIFQTVHREVGHFRRAYWCTKDWENRTQAQLYEVYMLWVMLLLPLATITFAYVSICRELWIMGSLRSAMATRGQSLGAQEQRGSFAESYQTSARGLVPGPGRASASASAKGGQARFTFRASPQTALSSSHLGSSPHRASSERSPVLRVVRKGKLSPEDDMTRKQVIKMLVAVIAIFVLCWAPILVSNVLTAFQLLDPLNYGYLKPMRQAFYLMAYANSCVNPFIYGFMSRHFRQTFLHAICTCLKGREHARSMFLQRQNSLCATRSSHVGYNSAGKVSSDLEMTVLTEAACGTCDNYSV
ncbi:gastrin/cholecystokinin type B receptor-like [Babylonia areolata]|uniref:gastrin/cholecystokinin type B receptor-like n=1 Tax=Babylonia areolata TaxID=304850 RepID=UPI003FD3101C